jgi:hypothetical protein
MLRRRSREREVVEAELDEISDQQATEPQWSLKASAAAPVDSAAASGRLVQNTVDATALRL